MGRLGRVVGRHRGHGGGAGDTHELQQEGGGSKELHDYGGAGVEDNSVGCERKEMPRRCVNRIYISVLYLRCVSVLWIAPRSRLRVDQRRWTTISRVCPGCRVVVAQCCSPFSTRVQ